MSLSIDVESVTAVLLSDGWMDVADKSFSLDTYEYITLDPIDRDLMTLHSGGQYGICANGFQFKTKDGDWIEGPLSSIQAVRSGVRKPRSPVVAL